MGAGATENNPGEGAIKHDVFLSFRGVDTRNNFTAHLHKALTGDGIDAFIDDRLDGGERIETLFRKISESLVSVVIFSPKYSNSRRCLDELVKISECNRTWGQQVLPVFIGVERTHIMEQAGPFGDDFARFLSRGRHREKEQAWRAAMVEIAGPPSEWESFHKSESQIVAEIVRTIEKILNQSYLKDLEYGFVGSTRIRTVESLLGIGSHDEGLISIGIFGTRGIGKTAIAKIVFENNSNAFHGACFLENIREKFNQYGLDSLQKQMVAQFLGVDYNPNASLRMLSPRNRKKLKRMKLLIVLDDVSSMEQVTFFAERHQCYGPGSRIIMTSRDKQVLKNGCKEVYEVEKLNNQEAFELFKFHAFKKNQPSSEFIELSRRIVACAQGLPLTLKELGCNLYDKGLKEWQSELAKLQENTNFQVSDNLMRVAPRS